MSSQDAYSYCPRCATPLAWLEQVEDSGAKSRLRCPSCSWTHWNNPTPVLAAVIECTDREGRLLEDHVPKIEGFPQAPVDISEFIKWSGKGLEPVRESKDGGRFVRGDSGERSKRASAVARIFFRRRVRRPDAGLARYPDFKPSFRLRP